MKKILDQFTDLPVSRQRKWQLRQAKLGLCVMCSKPAVMSDRCLKHAAYIRAWKHKKQGSKTWHKNTKFLRLVAEIEKQKHEKNKNSGNVGQPAHLAEVQTVGTECHPLPGTQAPQPAQQAETALPKVDENVQPVDGQNVGATLLGH